LYKLTFALQRFVQPGWADNSKFKQYLVFSVVNSAVNMTLPRLQLSAVLRRRCCRSPAAVARSPARTALISYSKPVARRCAAAE